MASNGSENETSQHQEEAPRPRRTPKEHLDVSETSKNELLTDLVVDLPTVNPPDSAVSSETSSPEVATTEQTQIPPAPKVVLRRTSSTSQETRIVPKVNCTEKIIICVDHSAAMYSSNFRRTTQSIKSSSTMQVLYNAIRQFVLTKSMIDKHHEFSLIMLNSDAQFISDFSPQGSEVLFMLREITENKAANVEDSISDKSFDLSLLFDQVEKHVNMPKLKNESHTAPPYIVRVLLVYGRSDCKLEFSGSKESFNKLRRSPYFFLDCIYIHDEPSEENCVTDIFTSLCELDENGTSYILEVGMDGSMSSLYNSFAKLLAHPLQRHRQIDNSNYDINSVSE